jgi:hypothetical protein
MVLEVITHRFERQHISPQPNTASSTDLHHNVMQSVCAVRHAPGGVVEVLEDSLFDSNEPLAKLKISRSRTKLLAHSGAIF